MTHDKTYEAYKVVTPGIELPVTLELVRMHLRNEDLRADDELVRAYIRTAAATVERTYGLALIEQTIDQYHSAFPANSDQPVLLRVAPLISITSVTYVDSAGDTQTWDADEYTTGRINGQPVIVPKVGYTYPSGLTTRPNAVTITYKAGFGLSADSVPNDIRSALLLMVGHLYENREDPPNSLPRASEALLHPWYRFSA